VEICVAALGVNKPFAYTGEVARIVVREETEGSVGLKTADLRDVNNGRDEVALPGGGGEAPYIPATTSLLQNHPNPFNRRRRSRTRWRWRETFGSRSTMYRELWCGRW